jgi:hypothetical protein
MVAVTGSQAPGARVLQRYVKTPLKLSSVKNVFMKEGCVSILPTTPCQNDIIWPQWTVFLLLTIAMSVLVSPLINVP